MNLNVWNFPRQCSQEGGLPCQGSVTLLPNQKKPARPWINLDFCCCCSSSLGNWSSLSMLEGVSRCRWSMGIQHTPKWLCVHYTVIIKNLCKEYRKDAWTVDERTERARNERQHFGGFPDQLWLMRWSCIFCNTYAKEKPIAIITFSPRPRNCLISL